MATIVTGQTTTTNVQSNQLAIEIGKEIRLLEPNWQALTIFTREARSTPTRATKFKWMEDEAKPRFDTTSGAVASTTSQEIPVTHGAYWQQWDLVLNTRTGEVMRVDSVAANTLSVTRGIGTTAANLNSGDELMLVGTAQPEGDTSKDARSLVPTVFENYTQISRTPFEISDTGANVSYQVTPAEWDRKQARAAVEHAKDIEAANLFGRKSATTPGSAETRTTAGALSFITTNQSDAGSSTLTESLFGAFLTSVFRYGSTEKIGFASATVLNALNKFPASKQVTQNDETTYGMNVTKWTGPFGTIHTVWHRMLEGQKYGGYMIVIDMSEVAQRPLQGRDTKLLPNRQPNDQDGRKSEYLTEQGLEFGQQRTHGVLSGVTG
jgi:Family of unknown function (DUF5309)